MPNNFIVKGFNEEETPPAPKETETKEEKNMKGETLEGLLKTAVVDELLAAYNYMASYTLSRTTGKVDFDPEFEQHEKEEYSHAHKLLMRLREIDSDGILSMDWKNFPTQNSMGKSWKQEKGNNSLKILDGRIHEEEKAIEFYSRILEFIKEQPEWDTTTEQLIKEIKADEERHLLDLRDLRRQQ